MRRITLLGILCLVAAAPVPAGAATVSSFGDTGAAPVGITIDSAGNVYTANEGANTASKLSAGGGGAAGGNWPAGAGITPTAIVYTDAGSVFVANVNDHSVSRIITATGLPFGLPWPVSTLGFSPTGIAADRAGNLYTANASSNSVTRITPGGTATAFASTGAGTTPYGLAFDRDGNLYTANSGTRTVSKFTSSGAAAGSPWPVSVGGSGLLYPWAVAVDSAGNVYTANDGEHSVSRITAAGNVTSFSVGLNPRALAVDSAGNVYAANAGSSNISKITAAGNVTVAFAVDASIDQPHGITIDRDGNLFVSNKGNDKVSKITPVGGDIQPAPPETPAAPSATAGDGSATVTVPANATDRRYGAPSSYTVAAVEAPSRSCTVTPPATSCQVNGLSNGTPYTFTARANLNTWQTGASNASGSVTPTATPTPTPDPTPTPTPDPTPTPAATVTVASVKQKVTRKGAYITSRVNVSRAGTITQQATTGSRKLKRWCRVTKRTTGAGAHTLKCNLGKRGAARCAAAR